MKQVLVIDDDDVFRGLLAEALTARGLAVTQARDITAALEAVRARPCGIVLDLRIAHESGLKLIPQLLALAPTTLIVVLTGYAAVATAVEAIKLGAVHYLAKPAAVQDILDAFTRTGGDAERAIDPQAMTIAQAEREHLERTLARNGGNISAAARALGMHRRTLQRKLDKNPPAE